MSREIRERKVLVFEWDRAYVETRYEEVEVITEQEILDAIYGEED